MRFPPAYTSLQSAGNDLVPNGAPQPPFHLSLDAICNNPADTTRVILQPAKRRGPSVFRDGEFYITFSEFWEDNDALNRAACSDNFDRLPAIKEQYDPQGLLMQGVQSFCRHWRQDPIRLRNKSV